VTDVWRVDIKAYSPEPLLRLSKVRKPEAVREQAVRAKKVHGMHVECVTNIVPTVNDSESELRSIAAWIASDLGPDTPWHVTRFVPYLEFADVPATPGRALSGPRDRAEEGLHYVYLGNIDVPGGEDTVCRSVERWPSAATASRRDSRRLPPSTSAAVRCDLPFAPKSLATSS
jgi:pyruvate formate lyase activating enzyme